MLFKTNVERLVNQYHQINRRYDNLSRDEKHLGKEVANLTEEEMKEYIQGTSRETRPYPQRA